MQILLVLAYLTAIVAANLGVTAFGVGASIVLAFVFIGLDLTTRDILHELWHHQGLLWKMALLISTGSLISYAINSNAGPIALASFLAFALAAIADTIAYTMLRDFKWIWRSNGSNFISAAVDSLVFPTIAFGALLPFVVLGQFAAKVLGGFIWSLILATYRKNTFGEISITAPHKS